MFEEKPKEDKFVETEAVSEQLEPPIRVSHVGGRYFFSFTSQEAAERFVKAFWRQVDIVKKLPEHLSVTSRFESGMWKPSQQLDSSCRTGMVAATTAEQKEGGVTTIVYINGNTGALQPFGVEALRNLDIKE